MFTTPGTTNATRSAPGGSASAGGASGASDGPRRRQGGTPDATYFPLLDRAASAAVSHLLSTQALWSTDPLRTPDALHEAHLAAANQACQSLPGRHVASRQEVTALIGVYRQMFALPAPWIYAGVDAPASSADAQARAAAALPATGSEEQVDAETQTEQCFTAGPRGGTGDGAARRKRRRDQEVRAVLDASTTTAAAAPLAWQMDAATGPLVVFDLIRMIGPTGTVADAATLATAHALLTSATTEVYGIRILVAGAPRRSLLMRPDGNLHPLTLPQPGSPLPTGPEAGAPVQATRAVRAQGGATDALSNARIRRLDRASANHARLVNTTLAGARRAPAAHAGRVSAQVSPTLADRASA